MDLNDRGRFELIDLDAALHVVCQAIENVNSFRSPDNAVSPYPDVVLVGEGGCLDSMEMITLVLAVERRILEISGRTISLLGGEDFESQLGAFRSPASLATLIVEKCRS